MASSGVLVVDGTLGDRSYKATPRKSAAQLSSRKASTGSESDERQEFKAIWEEVQKLGASHLDWKQRKQHEAKKLASLGGKPAKGSKMPISMGLNIKRKREKLEAETREQEILAGVLPAKSKKRAVTRETMEDRGLQASEGKFRGGVLYVEKPARKANVFDERGRGGRRGEGLSDRMFSENRPRGSKKGKGKGRGKSKGGKRKGGKRKH